MTMPHDSWRFRFTVAACAAAAAMVFTRVLWPVLQYTPFLLGFVAAVISSRVAGRQAGFLTVMFAVLGYGLLPLPLAQERLGRLLLGFASLTGAFSWIVARRYEIEGDLRRSQQRLQAVLSSLPVVLWAMNRDGNITLAEGSGLEVLDIQPRQLVGQSLFERYRDVPEAIANARRVLAGETFTGAVTLGNVVVETRYSPLRDHQGLVTGAIGVSLDVTERQAAQETLRASEQRLQTIIDAEPACVKLVSRDGVVLDVNRAGLEMLGAKALSDVKGRPVKDIVHPDDVDRFFEVHDAAVAGRPGRAEFRITGFDSSEHWVDSRMVPFDVTGTPGSERGVLSVTSDVTERKQLEAQLQQAQKLEAIGLLAGGIAHDFNNLLTAIGGYTEIVLASFDERDRRREDLLEVSKAAQRAAALTRQLLAVSRRQVLQPTVLDVNAMVTSIQKLLHRTVPENIDIQLDLTSAANMVRADRGQLEQVVLNLGINAGDAMPRGGRLTIAAQSVDVDHLAAARRPPMPPGRYVRLVVSDTGTGMAPETQAHIFEPFFTTKAGGTGTGLGLATVYGIVKQSNGFVWVDSAVGRGTTFEIYLPAVDDSVEAELPAARTSQFTGGSQTILLAEDDGAVRRFARQILTTHGYTVLDARDGDEALAVARGHSGTIDLLVTDVVMPGLSGRDLAARLSVERPDVRVLYTSGYSEQMIIRSGLNTGLTLLPKPFLPGDLLQKVGETLAA